MYLCFLTFCCFMMATKKMNALRGNWVSDWLAGWLTTVDCLLTNYTLTFDGAGLPVYLWPSEFVQRRCVDDHRRILNFLLQDVSFWFSLNSLRYFSFISFSLHLNAIWLMCCVALRRVTHCLAGSYLCRQRRVVAVKVNNSQQSLPCKNNKKKKLLTKHLFTMALSSAFWRRMHLCLCAIYNKYFVYFFFFTLNGNEIRSSR